MPYLIATILVLSIAIIALVIYGRHHLGQHKIIKKRLLGRIVLGLSVLLAVISLATIVVAVKGRNKQISLETIQVDSIKTQPKIASTKDLPAYEILKTQRSNATTSRLTVYTLSTDRGKITNLNKKLRADAEKEKITTLYVDYFDDRTVAQNYASAIIDAKTTAVQKKKLYSHYIAQSSPAIKTDNNILFMSNREDVVKQLTNTSKDNQ